MRRALAAALVLISTGCAGYQSALGFRARRAVLENDAPRFQELMAEAAETTPLGPLDNPKKTVLTHFLDLAGDPRFFQYIDGWAQKGWVDDDMICSIHRAHYRATRRSDPEAALRSADVCLATAREAAPHGDKSWQVEDCLDEAAFLTETATGALVRYLKIAADPKEPLKFRVGILNGMTNIPISGTQRKLDNDEKLSRKEAEKLVAADLERLTSRFTFIIATLRPFIDATLLAGGTALGAMQIEYASNSVGRSYVAGYSTSDNPDDNDLAWAWVRAMKHRKPVPELAGLGIWNKDKEPRSDVFWYFCTRPGSASPGRAQASAALGPMNPVDAISVRTTTRALDLEALRIENCFDKMGAPPYPVIRGPYPAESIGRGAVADLAAKDAPHGARTAVVLRRRVILGDRREPSPEPETSADSRR